MYCIGGGASGRVERINAAIAIDLEYKCNSIGAEFSVSLASVWGLDDHHPNMSMSSGLGGRTRRRISEGKKRRRRTTKGDRTGSNGKEIGGFRRGKSGKRQKQQAQEI